MITRRRFAGLMCAIILFPKNLVRAFEKTAKRDQKGLAGLENDDHIQYRIQDEIHIHVLGTDKHPATEQEVAEYNRRVNRVLVGQYGSKQNRLPYRISWHCLRTPFLVLAVGSDARPASELEVMKFRNEVINRLGQGENLLITRHVITPYVFHRRLRDEDTIVPRFPQVLHYGDAKFQWRIGMLSKDHRREL